MTLLKPLLDMGMTEEINYKNNPLNGVGLNALLTEIVDYYGFEILYAYLNINCFKINPSIASSIKFLKKTQWAREKVEAFYLYEFKNLPAPDFEQALLPPRARIIPDDQKPAAPAELTLADAELLRAEREQKAAEWGQSERRSTGSRNIYQRTGSASDRKAARSTDNRGGFDESKADPWAKWKK